MLRVTMSAAITLLWVVLISLGMGNQAQHAETNSRQPTISGARRSVVPPPDSVAFRLVVGDARALLPGEWSADPNPLVRGFFPPIGGAADLAASYEIDGEISESRAGSLKRWGIPEVDARVEIECVTGITPPGVPKTTNPYCLRLVQHYGLVASQVWEGSVDTTSYGLLGSEAPWRIRVLIYWVSPTTEGGWSLFDYFLQPAGGDWRVVGRRTILHAN
jgi:hypothetical protein